MTFPRSDTLTDKVVVITGSTRGIGRSIAEACGAAGARIMVSSRTDASVAETIEAFTTRNIECSGKVADVSSADDVAQLRDTAIETYGRIDAWVNNAGISLGYQYFDDLSAEDVERIVSINISGTMHGCRLLIPYFTEHGGILLNMSGRGFRGESTPFTAAYASTKAAVSSLTKSLAAENAHAPISIHALVPGMVETDFYTDIRISPRLERSKNNWRYALDAFGVSLEEVGTKTVEVLAQDPGRITGKTYSLLTIGKTMRGIVKMMWHRSRGNLVSEV